MNDMKREKFLKLLQSEPKYKKTVEMTIEESKYIVGMVGLKDRKTEPYSAFTTIGYSHGETECLFCGQSIGYNELKIAPSYCHECIEYARNLIRDTNEH